MSTSRTKAVFTNWAVTGIFLLIGNVFAWPVIVDREADKNICMSLE